MERSKKTYLIPLITIALATLSTQALAATDLASAVTELIALLTTAAGPALDWTIAGLGFLLAPKILVKIFYIIF
ncbi:MAG: hypothetical protein SVR94_00440 [Pseudomonadota bacterium]|nr:hypothetical protein [Pseudomonadota bacterium]